MKWLLLTFFAILALGSLALGIQDYFSKKAFFETAEHASAKIVEYRPDRNPKAADFCPRFEFTTKDGTTVGYEGDDCLSKPDLTQIGKTEEVYFDPTNPQIIYTKGWTGNEGSGLIFGAIGFVFFLFIGGVVTFSNYRFRRSYTTRKY